MYCKSRAHFRPKMSTHVHKSPLANNLTPFIDSGTWSLSCVILVNVLTSWVFCQPALRSLSKLLFLILFIYYLFTNLQKWRDIHCNTWIKHDKTWIRHHCYTSGDKIIFSKILFSLVKSAVRYLTLSTIPSPFTVILTFLLHAFAYSVSQTKRTNDMS